MLTLVRSPSAAIPLDPAVAPKAVGRFLEQLRQTPQRCCWVMPSRRRCRKVLHEWPERTNGNAALLPRLHTIESLVTELLAYTPRQRPLVSTTERLLRTARAWQEVTGRAPGPGLTRQLDRFIRDWLSCHPTVGSAMRTDTEKQPVRTADPTDPFVAVVRRYTDDLKADQLLDRVTSLLALLEELADPDSRLMHLWQRRNNALIFDGFHRLERAELKLIAALSRHCDTLLWLVGVPGQQSWSILENAAAFLQECGTELTVIDHDSPPAHSLATLGRALFRCATPGGSGGPFNPEPTATVNPLKTVAVGSGLNEAIPGAQCIFRLEAQNAAAEVDLIANRIKVDYRESAQEARPLRLSDIAVIIPGPAYDPLIREIFPRHGLPFNLAGQALEVAESRPARLLTDAIQLIQGEWRRDLLLDYLSQPLVRRSLANPHRLHDLLDQQPPSLRRLNFTAWTECWARHLSTLRGMIAGWASGERALPERVTTPRGEFVGRQTDLANELEALAETVRTVLKPVVDMETTLVPGGGASIQTLAKTCVELLQAVGIEQWLAPPMGAVRAQIHAAKNASFNPEPTATANLRRTVTVGSGLNDEWVGFEKDQQAYAKLLAILDTLAGTREDRLPQTANGRADLFAALLLALHTESYQIKAEDDAGVQVFEMRELRGLRFRHVYVLGLVDGQVPPLPEEGMPATRRRQDAVLREQLRQKESEAAFLFSQTFEAAQERLVLSRPICEEDRPSLPSPFLRAVEDRTALSMLPSPAWLTCRRDAAAHVGRHGIEYFMGTATPADCFRGVTTGVEELASWQDSLLFQTRRQGWPKHIRVDAPALMRLLFPDDRPFSPSELETYAACGFRYFGRRLLRLKEREPEETRLRYGSLMHRVLQRFYSERGQNNGQPLPPISRADRPRLLELFQREWQLLPERTLLPDVEELFRAPNGVLDLFLDEMEHIEKEVGNILTEFELSPINLSDDSDGRPTLMIGTIDRVDVDRNDPQRAFILDYKTGRLGAERERRAKMEDGRLLQLLLYALALGLTNKDLQAVGGAYLHLSEKKRSDERTPADAIVAMGMWARMEQSAFDLEAARRKALEFVAAIREGRFPLTSHGADAAFPECTSHCTLRHACRHPDGYKGRGVY